MASQPLSARALALRAFTEWHQAWLTSCQSPRREGARGYLHCDQIFHRHASKLSLPADRRLLGELFYGVIRNLSLLRHLTSKLVSRPLDTHTEHVLILGLYQTFIARMADHAAVNETVGLAGRSKSLVNAVLRRSLREREQLLRERESLPLALRHSHPEFLVERWVSTFGAEMTTDLCQWNNTPPPVFARVNTLRISRDDLLAAHPEKAIQPSELHPVAVRLAGAFDELLNDGLVYVQDPSTLLAVDLLAPEPGERILDACAAPGGKTTYAAQLMADRGQVVAVDLRKDRLEILKQNVHRLGLQSIRPLVHDWTDDTSLANQQFDRALVDVPCTNSGVLRRRADARWRLQPDDFKKMAQLQFNILDRVWPLIRPGGLLVYSTCSIDAEENEGVVEKFLRAHTSSAVRGPSIFSFPLESGMDGAFAVRITKTSP